MNKYKRLQLIFENKTPKKKIRVKLKIERIS